MKDRMKFLMVTGVLSLSTIGIAQFAFAEDQGEQQGKVTVERRPSPKGPSRKYYVVTEEGRQALLEFQHDWSQLCQLVEKIFKEEPDE